MKDAAVITKQPHLFFFSLTQMIFKQMWEAPSATESAGARHDVCGRDCRFEVWDLTPSWGGFVVVNLNMLCFSVFLAWDLHETWEGGIRGGTCACCKNVICIHFKCYALSVGKVSAWVMDALAWDCVVNPCESLWVNRWVCTLMTEKRNNILCFQ